MEKKIQSLAHLASKHFTAYLDEVSLGNGRISKIIRKPLQSSPLFQKMRL